ncbi:putative metallo-hydrolase YflN [subsurface metagenome]
MEIIPHVYQITHRNVNVILIVEEELTLIDTGFHGSSSKIIGFIRGLGRSPEEITLIILTHNHLDHIGGLVELRRFIQPKVAIHKADISDIDSQSANPRFARKLFSAPPFSSLRPIFYLEPSEVALKLEGGEVFSPLGGLRVIHTPGHTLGSICLFSPQKKLLIVGDALNHRYKNPRFPLKLVSADLTQAIDSVKQIARLDFDILCFGHGKPITRDASAQVRELIKRHGGKIDSEP